MRLFLPLLFLPLLMSFRFNPMSQSIELGEGNNHAQFMIENNTESKMAIELTVKERVLDQWGKETLPDTIDLTIFPPQMVIPPKERRTVRVSWKGAQKLEKEKAFRVIAEQLPLNVDEKRKKGSGIQMLMRYMAALYVTPPDAEAKLSVSVVDSKPGALTVQVKNSGDRHKILLVPRISFSKAGSKVSLSGPELRGLADENVLAGSSRNFVLKTSQSVPKGAEGSIKVND